MKEFKVKEDILNAVLQYLGTKPYVETFQLIQALQGVEEIKAEEVAKDKK